MSEMARWLRRTTFLALILSAAAALADAPPSGRNAQVVSATGVPTTLAAGEKATVSLTFKNTSTGGSIWSLAAGYKLGSRRPADNTTWGLTRVPLSKDDAIPVGQEKTFTFSFQAPSTPGVYTFAWSLIKEGHEWVGQVYEAPITVTASDSGSGGPPDPLDESRITSFDITLSNADWSSIVSHPEDEAWKSATVIWNGASTYKQVGIRGAKGSIPPNYISLSLKFDKFIKGQRFHGIKKLKLYANGWDPTGTGPVTGDNTLMKNRIAYHVYRSMGIEAPRIPYCWVSINGAARGLYGAEERTDRKFFVRRYGETVNQAYKWSNSAKNGWSAGRDYEWHGAEAKSYIPSPFVMQIDSADPSGADLVSLLRTIHDKPEEISSILDVDSFLRFMAVEQVVDEIDGYSWGWDGSETFVNNHVIYLNPKSGKFIFLKWDADHSYAVDAQLRTLFANFDRHVLTRKLILENSANQKQYKDYIRQLINGYHQTDAMWQRIDRVKNQIDPYVRKDPFRNYDEWIRAVAAMKARIKERNDYLSQQVK